MRHFYRIVAYLVYIAIASPMIALLWEGLKAMATDQSEWIELVVPHGRRLELLIRSLSLSSTVALFGLFLGMFGGSLIYRSKVAFTKYLKYGVILFAVVPPYIHALAWSIVFDAMSFVQIDGVIQSWWVQSMSYTPYGVGLASLGYGMIDSELVDAARVMRNNNTVFIKIIVPMVFPMLTVGSAFMFLFSLMDYSIPTLFQVQVYALEIFSEFSSTYQTTNAFLLSIPLLLIAFCLLMLIQASFKGLLRQKAFSTRDEIVFTRPMWVVFFEYIAGFVLFLQVFVPFFTLILKTESPTNFVQGLVTSKDEILSTLHVAVFVAVIGLLSSLVVASQLHKESKVNPLWWFIIIMPIVLPGSIIGIGLIYVSNWIGLEGTMMIPIFAGINKFIPFAVLILYIAFKKMHPLLLDAAMLLQKSEFHTLYKIKIPMLLMSLIASFFILFVLTAGELGATLMVIPPGKNTVTIKIYNYLHYGATSKVASLSLLILLISFVLGFFILKIMRKNWGKQE